MSYVLDALRRAEAERLRGQVPGVHAVTLAASPTSGAGGEPGRRRGPVVAIVTVAAVVLVALAVAGLWWSASGDPASRREAAAPLPSGAPVKPDRGVRPPPPDLPPPVVSPPAGVGPSALPPPVVVARAAPAVPAAVAAVPAVPAVPAATAAIPSAAARPAPAAPAAVVRFTALPEADRRAIPPMVFGGATDSPEPSARMLIINGQLWREGDEVAPGLRLDRIALRSAQFSFRGQRFEIVY
jgi:general secretion pathway protein B